MPTLTIPESVYAKLASEAAQRKISVDEVAVPILERELDASPLLYRKPLTGEEWERTLEQFVARAAGRDSRYPPGFEVDCSRESIYRDDRP